MALHILDYLGVDYPGTVRDGVVVNAAEYAEQIEFAGQLGTLIDRLPANPLQARLQSQTHHLQDLIKQHAPGQEVKAVSAALGNDLILAFEVSTAPGSIPDIAQAAATFQQLCSGCHGSEGRGDGRDAAGLEPPPANFHDRDRQDQRSLYGLYSAITLGVDGTAMQSFAGQLNAEQRWALAFYVGRIPYSQTLVDQGAEYWQQHRPDALTRLGDLTSLTAVDAREQWGDDGPAMLAYLRQHPEQLAHKETENLAQVRKKLAASLTAYSADARDAAQAAAVAAYLEGFEPLEHGLRARDPDLVIQVEQAMSSYRQALAKGMTHDEVSQQYERVLALLEQVETRLQDERLSSDAAFFSAFIILVREGLEAILILAAVAGVLIKADRRDALRYLHAGWISALLLGGMTWVLANFFISVSGAGREITEGITALFAAVMLFYVGFWLHRKTQAQRWQQFVKERVHSALHGGALWVLALVAFLAVYREVFETVLFYQALWLQSRPDAGGPLISGIVVAAGTLVLLAWIILRSSLRLPLRLFFNVNAAIMLALAVAFTGHGINALQEAGHVPVDPVTFPQIGLLGIYPNLEVLFTQALLLLLIAVILLAEKRSKSSAIT